MFDTTVTLALAVIAIILSVLFHKYKSRSSEKRMTKMMRHIYAQKKPQRGNWGHGKGNTAVSMLTDQAGVNSCFPPESGYTKGVIFSDAYSCLRPKAAVREIKKTTASWLV